MRRAGATKFLGYNTMQLYCCEDLACYKPAEGAYLSSVSAGSDDLKTPFHLLARNASLILLTPHRDAERCRPAKLQI